MKTRRAFAVFTVIAFALVFSACDRSSPTAPSQQGPTTLKLQSVEYQRLSIDAPDHYPYTPDFVITADERGVFMSGVNGASRPVPMPGTTDQFVLQDATLPELQTNREYWIYFCDFVRIPLHVGRLIKINGQILARTQTCFDGWECGLFKLDANGNVQ